MTGFRTVVIERAGGHFQVTQDGRPLFLVPSGILERFSADSAFPPAWEAVEPGHPLRRLFWNPDTAELLMAGLEEHPARFAEAHGASPYRSYLQAIWLPEPPVLLLRPYWNPSDPYDPFDDDARRASFRAQWRFREILEGLRPPPAWTVVFNAVDAYLDALGVRVEGPEQGAEPVRELSLTPPLALSDPAVRSALEALATREVGRAFPVVRGDALVGAHALELGDLHRAEALLAEAGIAYQVGSYLPH